MLKASSTFLTITLLLLPATALAEDPLLHFERIHTRIVGESDNRISLKVFPDGKAYATFPRYMKNAGRHEFQLSEPQLSEIIAMVDTLTTLSQETLGEERAKSLSGSNEGVVHEVSDPDAVKFSVQLADRGQHTLITLSPDVFQNSGRATSQLGKLAEMEQQLRELMRKAAEKSK